MERYFVFAGDDYYPSGGWSDYREAFDELPAAIEYADKLVAGFQMASGRFVRFDWAEVVDVQAKDGVYWLRPGRKG